MHVMLNFDPTIDYDDEMQQLLFKNQIDDAELGVDVNVGRDALDNVCNDDDVEYDSGGYDNNGANYVNSNFQFLCSANELVTFFAYCMFSLLYPQPNPTQGSQR